MNNLFHNKIIDIFTDNYIYNCCIHKYEDNIFILDDKQIVDIYKSCNHISIVNTFFNNYKEIDAITNSDNYNNFIELMKNNNITTSTRVNIEDIIKLYLLCAKTIILYNNYFIFISTSNLYYKIEININNIKQIYQKIMSFFIFNNIGIFEKKNILFDI